MLSAALRRRVLRPARFFTTHPPPTPPPRTGILRTLLLVGTVSLGAYTTGALFPHPYLTFIAPRPAPGPPSNPDSPDSLAYTADLERTLQSLPLLQSLRAAPDANNWYEVRPYKHFPEDRRVNNLSAGALRGPGKLALMPMVRARWDETESVAILHVGRGLCGHDGIVHGGLLATLLDETLARTAINNLPDKIGVTAKLSISYKAPTFADQFIVIKVRLEEKNGRKTTVSGRVEDLKGNLLVEANALFVQPKYSKMLSNSVVKKAMGEPEPRKKDPVLLAEGIPPPAAKS
ncbi:HotDog domain-containing protein [Boletus reticuloceps]|uniref:HotDog domain-containing protein n=1 Tax=Boletus reticuloceps TaxID=495285 RepID=A0A8I3AA56_9AGAM|nr:HotDog domain-containing protein [Boletus reticuloceps]